jgi:hypothetical protein
MSGNIKTPDQLRVGDRIEVMPGLAIAEVTGIKQGRNPNETYLALNGETLKEALSWPNTTEFTVVEGEVNYL